MIHNAFRKAPWQHLGRAIVALFEEGTFWPGVIRICDVEEENGVGEWETEIDEVLHFWVVFFNNYQGDWVPHSMVADLTESNLRQLIPVRGLHLEAAVQEAVKRRSEFSVIPLRPPPLLRSVDEGDIVLCRFSICPWWPSIVKKDDKGDWITVKERTALFHCKYLGTHDHSWVSLENIREFSTEELYYNAVSKSNIFYNQIRKATKMARSILQERVSSSDDGARSSNGN